MARKRNFTAVYKKSGKWYLGWIEEIPGVNTQGRTLREAKENLKEALLLIVENLTNLGLLAGKDFTMFTFPPKLQLDGAPTRVVAEIF